MKYTVSTMIFESLKEAEEQVGEWVEEGTLKEGTMVFGISEVYIPVTKLIKEKHAL